jgi:hypothetical protein
MADESPAEPPSNVPVGAEVVPLESVDIAETRETAGPLTPDPGYTADGVPTFESVREKIETRYGTAIGAAELSSETPESRSVEEQYEARQRAAAERLEQIRRSMHDT